jgi:hypothetical protein
VKYKEGDIDGNQDNKIPFGRYDGYITAAYPDRKQYEK